MARPHALSQLNPDREKLFGFSEFNNFQGPSGATTSAANDFKFGATANMNTNKNNPLSHILTMLLISNICDEFLIRL